MKSRINVTFQHSFVYFDLFNFSSKRIFICLCFLQVEEPYDAWLCLALLSNLKVVLMVGGHSTMDSVLLSHPAALGLIPGVPKNISEFLMLSRLIDSTAA